MGELVKGRNEPGPGLLCVLAVVSGIKGLDMEVVAKQVRRNTMACFFPGEEEECEELKS